MRSAHPKTRFFACKILVVLLVVLLVQGAPAPVESASQNIDPNVAQAILKCRAKLSEDPTFPKAQHMLGILLGSLADDEDGVEIPEWYYRDTFAIRLL